MRKIIIFIIFLISIFIVNLIFYFISDDYRFFLKKIKNTDKIVYLEKKEYNDKIDNEVLTGSEIISTNKVNDKIFEPEE